MIQMNLLRKRLTDLDNEIIVARGEGIDWEGHVHTAIFKTDNQHGLCSTWNSAQSYVVTWMGAGFGGEGILAYVWLGPFSVHLKISQYC